MQRSRRSRNPQSQAVLVACLALVAVAVFALPGAASAENICSETPNGANECPMGKAYGVGQVFETELSTGVAAELPDLFVKCTVSEIQVQVTELKLGKPV